MLEQRRTGKIGASDIQDREKDKLIRPRLRRGAISIEAVAGRVARSLAVGHDGEAWRWLLQFTDDFRGSSPRGRYWLVSNAPPSTGEIRYDAAIAALVEHLCVESGIPIPRWTWDPLRIVEPWWFVADLPALEATTLRDSPISFKRHGVFVSASAFDRV